MDNSSLNSGFTEPLLGVLISGLHINRLNNQKPSVSNLALAKANEQVKTTLYFFSMQDVDLIEKKINGTYFDKKYGLWGKKVFPYPNILYRRGNTRRSLKDKLYQFKNQLKKMGANPLNYQVSFNKWDVIENLKSNQKLLPHIPNTIIYNTPQDLIKMLCLTDKVYLKACRGGQGKQVMRVIKLSEGGYECSYFIQRLHVYKVSNIKKLVEKIEEFFKSKKFIIQEAIDLISLDSSIVDLRAEVQRNGQGEIKLAGIPARIGRSKSPITTHASSFPFEYFFANFMKYSKKEIDTLKNNLISLLTTFYESIEDIYGPSGEIGIDIGMDKNGQFWFIECNSLSLKVSLFNAYDQETIGNSFVNLLEYAKYISATSARH